MPGDKWLEAYDGQSTEELLALEDEYRIDSLVVAFESALQQKEASQPLSRSERYVLAIEALEREVNNGGYSQFFLNSSHDYLDVVEEALVAIGCVKTAALTRRAIDALGLSGNVTGEMAEAVVGRDDEAIRSALDECDSEYFGNDEAIADMLFSWIKRNRDSVRVGDA